MADEGWTASGYFGSMSEEYDSLIHRAVPRYDTMTERLVEHFVTWEPPIIPASKSRRRNWFTMKRASKSGVRGKVQDFVEPAVDS